MKVLWLTNIIFPEALKLLSGESEFKSSGGWMLSLANDLTASNEVELSVATVSSMVNTLTILQGFKTTYYIIPWRRGDYLGSYRKDLIAIRDSAKPDIVHLHGTESMYGLYYVKACGSKNVVVSIQGVMKEIATHCNDGLSFCDLLSSVTLRDMLHRNTLFHTKRRFCQSALLEDELLKMVSHVIGRTEFDKEFVHRVSPHSQYYHCNESLREEFYEGNWSFDDCVPHSVFISQCTYPVKGLHQAVKVFPRLKEKYPDFQVRIAGIDVRSLNTGYGKLLNAIFKNLCLDEYVTFLGPLSAEEMKVEMLKANVFLSPSTIENSPNSVGEAQLLGVPVVASAVGGVPSMIEDKKSGNMYPFEDLEALITCICDVFEHSQFFCNCEMRRIACNRHNKKENTEAVLCIYHKILKSDEFKS